MIKLYLFDIEGTTTDINFVHKVLFPYSEKHMEEYVLTHHQSNEVVKKAVEMVRETVQEEEKQEIGLNEVIAKLLQWIKEDRKHPALKEIQGCIWDAGYTNNHFKGHVYHDVKPLFQKIVKSDAKVGIYSSGSEHAQKLIFGYSEEGDLTPYISCYFDTRVGGKRKKTSYEQIAQKTGFDPKEIHFFSDVKEELQAASEAGFTVTLVCRDSSCESAPFDCVTDFTALVDKV